MDKEKNNSNIDADMEKRLWYDDGHLIHSIIKDIESSEGKGCVTVKFDISWSGIISKKDISDSIERTVKETKMTLFK